ncbi:GntR family transcriptional regulator [Streptosporangiaceae bacterium NEAU-GS5]|nr:GntR family transcriptional regulator [Streptosporangiaceae bacterium NEAU-GS5]
MTEDRPLYLRIVEALRQKILSGELAPGARLPSRPELMREYGVSDSVAVRVAQILVSEGLAEARSGSGTYVRAKPKQRLTTRSFTLRLTVPFGTGSPYRQDMERQDMRGTWSYRTVTAVAPPEVRERLRLGEEGDAEDVVRTDYVFEANGEPSELSTSWEPLALTEGTPVALPEDGPHVGVMDRMHSIGVRIIGSTEEVRARLGAAEECAALRVPPGSIVFAIRRMYYGRVPPEGRERVVEMADIVLSAERYVLLYGMPRDEA